MNFNYELSDKIINFITDTEMKEIGIGCSDSQVIQITKNNDITSLCENISINYESGHLMFAGRDTVDLAKRYGTPLYLIDEDDKRGDLCLCLLLALFG